jgi:hypothetical protein
VPYLRPLPLSGAAGSSAHTTCHGHSI